MLLLKAHTEFRLSTEWPSAMGGNGLSVFTMELVVTMDVSLFPRKTSCIGLSDVTTSFLYSLYKGVLPRTVPLPAPGSVSI